MLLTKISLIFAVNILMLIVGLLLVREQKNAPQFKPIFSSLLAYLGLSVCYFIDDTFFYLRTELFYYLEYVFVLALCYAFFEACIAMSTDLGAKTLLRSRIGFAVLLAVWLPLWFYTFWTAGSFQLQNLLVAPPIIYIFLTFVWLGNRVIVLQRSSEQGLLRDWHEGRAKLQETVSFFIIICVTAIASIVLIALRSRLGNPADLGTLFIALNGVIILMICVFYMKFVARRFDVTSQLMFGLQTSFLVISAFVLTALFNDRNFQPVRILRYLDHHELIYKLTGLGKYQITSQRNEIDDIAMTRVSANQDGIALVRLPFAFNYAGQDRTEIWVTSNGSISFDLPYSSRLRDAYCLGQAHRIVALCSGGEKWTPKLALFNDRAVFDWYDIEERQFITRLSLFADGSFSMAYSEVPLLSASFLRQSIGFSYANADLPVSAELDDFPYISNESGFWFDLSLMHRKELHLTYLPIFGFMIGAFLLNSVVVWAWVNFRVRRPLRETHEALDGIRSGVLNNKLGSRYNDEFADLARGFSEMESRLRSLRASQDEVTEAIEAEFKARRVNESLEEMLPEAVSGDAELLERILGVIEKNAHQTDFQVLDLAHEVGLSTRQLHRKVLNLAGMTPLTLIRTVRLKKAKRILEVGGNSVSKAAIGSGFRDIAYFSRVYRKEFGELPSETAKTT